MKDMSLIGEYDLLDYYIGLKNFIMNFMENNFPMTMVDNAAILNGKDTARTLEYKYVKRLLKSIMDEVLYNEINRRKQDVNKTYLLDSIKDQERKLLELKKEMITILKSKYVLSSAPKL